MAKKKTLSAAIREALTEEMRRDNNVMMLGEDIGVFGGCFGVTAGMYDEFPGRIFDTPITEEGYCNAGIGLAASGKRPVVELMFADFCAVAYDPVCLEAPKLYYVTGGQAGIPIVFRGAQGGFISGGCHHSNCVEGWVQNHPGLIVISPSTPKDAKGLLKSAIRNNNPVLFLEHKLQYAEKGEVPEEEYTIPIGVADVVREGADVTIIAWQVMRTFSEQAAEELARQGISAELVDPRTIRPFDYETVYASVKKTKRCIVVHEHPTTGGIGGEIATRIMQECWSDLKKPVARLGSADVSIAYGPEEAFMHPTKESIMEAVRALMK